MLAIIFLALQVLSVSWVLSVKSVVRTQGRWCLHVLFVRVRTLLFSIVNVLRPFAQRVFLEYLLVLI